MVATPVLELLHVPLGVPSVNVVALPAHNVNVPEIGNGLGLTVNVSEIPQPVAVTE